MRYCFIYTRGKIFQIQILKNRSSNNFLIVETIIKTKSDFMLSKYLWIKMVDRKICEIKAWSSFKKSNFYIFESKKFNIYVTQQCSWFSSLVQLQIFPGHWSQIKIKWVRVLEKTDSKLLLSLIEVLSNFLRNGDFYIHLFIYL